MRPSAYTRRRFLAAAAAGTSALLTGCRGSRGVQRSSDTSPQFYDVFAAGTDGYHTYRIPALLALPTGTLLAFCEGRKTSRSDDGDIDLLVKTSTDAGRTWSRQRIVHEEGGSTPITIGNPCPVRDARTGRLWLPFTRNNDTVHVTHSDDEGVTWSPPRAITAAVKSAGWSWYATGPGVGIQLEHGSYAGRLVIPCDHREVIEGETVKRSHVFFSDDGGATWDLGGSVGIHTDECQVVERPDGSLLINMRNYWERDGGVSERGGMRATATSRDGGRTWSALRFEPTLVEPVCQASFLRYTDPTRHDRSRLLFSNPALPDRRANLTVRLSYDEGATWPVAQMLHPGPAAYSCLAALPDGSIGCLYERGAESPYEHIMFARFSLAWLTGGADTLPTTLAAR